MDPNAPAELDLKKDRGLAVRWQDGTSSYYPISYLRRMSPSADMKELREEMERNPLAILPSTNGGQGGSGTVVASDAEMVGNYAIKITFSDGHNTGLYSWAYLREIDPERTRLRDEARLDEARLDEVRDRADGDQGSPGSSG